MNHEPPAPKTTDAGQSPPLVASCTPAAGSASDERAVLKAMLALALSLVKELRLLCPDPTHEKQESEIHELLNKLSILPNAELSDDRPGCSLQ